MEVHNMKTTFSISKNKKAINMMFNGNILKSIDLSNIQEIEETMNALQTQVNEFKFRVQDMKAISLDMENESLKTKMSRASYGQGRKFGEPRKTI
jgi:hypothetical protein